MRLDKYLVENNLFSSRNRAATAIKNNEISVNGEIVSDVDFLVKPGYVVVSNQHKSVAGQGYFKLQKAVDHFNVSIDGKTFIDIGASNGGFTHFLLDNGAKRVYAVDVGKSQLEQFLIDDGRVTVVDNTNARNMSPSIFSDAHMAVVDVSFISLTLVLQNIADCINNDGEILALIKPQFELDKKRFKNGIVNDAKSRENVVKNICNFAKRIGLGIKGVVSAPIKKNKNIEYFVYLTKKSVGTSVDVESINIHNYE